MFISLLRRQFRISVSGYALHFPQPVLANKFYSSSATIGYEGKKCNHDDSLLKNVNSVTCMTIKASQPMKRELVERNIIDYIASSQKFKVESDIKGTKNVSLVILATPNHVSWLDSASIQSLLKNIKISDVDDTQSEIDVIGACVDGIPPQHEHSELKESNLEGLSILYGSSITHSQELWSTSESCTDLQELSSLIFKHKCDQSLSSSEVTIPLANTIFTNGKRSTLSVSKWRKTKDSVTSIRTSTHRNNVSINLFSSEENLLNISLSPLTLPRKIETGLGNIVRSLNVDGNKIIPASQELEVAVMQAHKSKSLSSDHSVWALIFPSHIEHEDLSKISLVPDCIYKTSVAIGNLIKKGVKICRVVSGGGGWGPKQGLLALDPELTFKESATSPFDYFDSDDSRGGKERKGFQDLVLKGAFIQFFQAENNPSYHLRNSKTIAGNQFIFGTFPCKDETQLLCSNSRTILIPELFGCVSRNGLFLNSTPVGSTKIDTPYSFIQVIDLRDRGSLKS